MSKCLNKYLKIKHKNPFINDFIKGNWYLIFKYLFLKENHL